MGQKVNPTGLRVGIIRDWDAKWYAEKDFASNLHEDLRIRKYIESKLADASVSTVEIERAAKRVNISIHTAKPGMVIGKGGSEVEKLRKELNNLTGKRVHINIVEIKKPDLDAKLVGESIAELGGEQQALEIDGQEAPGVIKSQVKTALPALGVPSKIYSLIRSAATEAGELTQEKEFYGHVPVIRGFEIILDENLDNSGLDSNPHMLIYAGTRNLVTEAMTAAITEEIPDADAYRKILRGYIVYGCAVTNANCGAKAFVKV